MKSILVKNWHFYILGCMMIYSIKHFYTTAGFDDLGWILAPTAWWAEIISGNTFQKLPHIGYVNHANEFLIVSTCSGVNYLIIIFSTLLYSFIHRWDTFKRKLLWLVSSMILTYLLTIFINGFRIVFAMYLFNADIYGGLITPERIHRIEGIVLYFGSLFTIFILAERVIRYFVQKGSLESKVKRPKCSMKKVLFIGICPFFWYFLITLGIPLMNKAYEKDTPKFVEHAIVIVSVFLICIAIYYLFIIIKDRLSGRRLTI